MENPIITKLSPPWYVYHRKVQSMFGRDPEVHVKELADIGDGKFSYMILVYNDKKADAIKALLPQTVKIGNITIEAVILGPTEDRIDVCQKPITEIFEDAFSGNPIFETAVERELYGMKFVIPSLKKRLFNFGTMICQIIAAITAAWRPILQRKFSILWLYSIVYQLNKAA